jgi:hypothetical protein
MGHIGHGSMPRVSAIRQARRGGDQLIRVSMTAVVLAVAAVAAWVSYWHAVAVIEKYGAEDEMSAHLVPASVDGMIYASSMVLLWCARYRLAVPALARWALALGIAATLAANILHGIERGPLAAALAAWPAIALVISYELIMWVVRSGRELADRVHAGSGEPGQALADVAPAQLGQERPMEQTVDTATPITGVAQMDRGEPVQEGREPEPKRAVPAGDVGQAGDGQGERDRRAMVAGLLAQDPSMSGAALARALGVHETTGRKYRREALNSNGHSA